MKIKLSKVKYVPHDSLKLQKYFYPSILGVQESKLLFQSRSRMVEVKVNFRNKHQNTLCPVCKIVGTEDSQHHVFECVGLIKNKNIIMLNNVLYSHIFDEDTKKQVDALRMFNCLWIERKKILKLQEQE